MLSKQKNLARSSVFSIIQLLLIWILVPGLRAQQDQGVTQEAQKWRRKPAFNLKFGSFFPSLNTIIRIDSESLGQGTEIDLEDTLQLDKSPIIVRGDADIRVFPWLSLDLGFYSIKRGRATVIDSEIQAGDTIFNLNQSLKTKFNSTFLRTYVKFSFIHNPRLDFGVWAGANFAFFKLRLEGQDEGEVLVEEDDIWAPIPAAGIHISYTLIPNLHIFGKVGYFYFRLPNDLKFTSSVFSISLNYYFYKFLGIGIAYENDLAMLDGKVSDFLGKIDNKYGGFQIYGIIGF